ncbi:MAG: hypothetical protein JO269_06160 [Burkholderiaceae bacterium]|nr:hypothetical protein [Burkholderiaceae bacterium]
MEFDERKRPSTPILLILLLAHAGLIYLGILSNRSRRVEPDQPQTTLLFLPQLPVARPKVTPPPTVVPRVQKPPITVTLEPPAPQVEQQASGKPSEKPPVSVAPGFAQQSLQEALKLDREAEKSEKPSNGRPADSLQSKFDRAFAGASKAPRDGSGEDITLHDGRKMRRIHSIFGDYCLEICEGPNGQRQELIGPCPIIF